MDVVSLRSDCGRCAGLCCIALAFDRSQGFAIDKAAGSPCPNLGAGGCCAIHASRADAGFTGCVQYDCLGAGQRVVQNLFNGRTWLEQPRLLAAMLDAFFIARIAHQNLELLELSTSLPLSRHQEKQRRQLVVSLSDPLASLDQLKRLACDAKAWLRKLGSNPALIARRAGQKKQSSG